MAAERKAIIFYRCNLFIFFISSTRKKDQPLGLNQTWMVGRKCCRFTNALQNFRPPPPQKMALRNIKFWTTFSATSALSTAYLRNETSHGQTKNATVNIQRAPDKVTYFPWPLTQKRLRSVCLLWRIIRRPLRCNHQSCDVSIFNCYVETEGLCNSQAVTLRTLWMWYPTNGAR